jgi:hypothetical protein
MVFDATEADTGGTGAGFWVGVGDKSKGSRLMARRLIFTYTKVARKGPRDMIVNKN